MKDKRTWPEEHLKAAIELREQGLSYSLIADAMSLKFNKQFTKNAVLGQMSRLKIGHTIVSRPKRKPERNPEHTSWSETRLTEPYAEFKARRLRERQEGSPC